MTPSVFLARLIGPVMLVVGIAVFLNQRAFRDMAEEFLASRALLFLSGLLIMPMGVAIVLTHNVWAANWRVLITLIGWLTLIRGAVRILAPEAIMGFAAKVLRKKQMMPVAAAVTGVLGLVLCYFGYVT